MTFEFQTTDKAGQDQLDAVAAEFDLWRSQKTKRAEKVPRPLLREAQKLSQHYMAVATMHRSLCGWCHIDRRSITLS